MQIEKAIRRRRKHSDEFKEELVRACRRAGTSVAGVALANGVNANLLRKWMQARGVAAPSQRAAMALSTAVATAPQFVPVTLTPAAPAVPDIRIEAHRGDAIVTIDWPVSAASECAAWLRDWLK